MTSGRAGGRVEALYHQMLVSPVHERAVALTAAYRDDPALQADVQSLLGQAESAAGFLAVPPLRAAIGRTRIFRLDNDSPSATIPDAAVPVRL
jgi:hypothetical protein